jgi:flagellar biogenesis protein FliO
MTTCVRVSRGCSDAMEATVLQQRTTHPGWFWAFWAVIRERAGARQPARRRLRLIESLAVGGRRTVTLIECDGRHFLIGGGSDSVQCIQPVEPETTL